MTAKPAAADQVDSLTTYLVMQARPERAAARRPEGDIVLMSACAMPATFYRYLYREVGEDWGWFDRAWLSDEELLAQIHASGIEIQVLYADGVPAGYFELNFQSPPNCEIAYFGIARGFMGRGLGPWLLDEAIREAFDRGARRLWLHTCDRDHPKAVNTYTRAGFQVYDKRIERVRAAPPS